MSDRGIDRFQAGEVEVFCLTDGETQFGAAVFADCPPEVRAARLAAAGRQAIDTQFNAYVLRHAGGVDLVDTGCGTHFGPTAGRMAGLLADLGIAPEDVRRVILTHLHRDHVGGAMAEGRLVYPNARFVLHAVEHAYWMAEGGLGAETLAIAAPPLLLEDGADLGHGITLVHLPGHTPGQCGLRIGGLMLVADLLHSEALQLPDPGLSPNFDTDPVLAALTRRTTLQRIAETGLVWSGSHMLGPSKFARLRASGDGFERVPL